MKGVELDSRPVVYLVTLLGLLLGVTVLKNSTVQAESDAGDTAVPSPILTAQGAQYFAQYCASCHGAGGRGDGPAAAALRTPPADLTKIAARRDGVFPSAEIRYHIDGRYEHAAHGTREMPVWGERFTEEIPETQVRDELVRGRLYTLVDYLQSIQDPPPKKVE